MAQVRERASRWLSDIALFARLKKKAVAVREKLLIRLMSPPIDLAIKILATDGRVTASPDPRKGG